MQGNQLSDNSNTTAGTVNERKKTKFVKRESDRNEEKWTNQHDYWEQRMSNSFFCKRTNDIEVKAQNLLHRKQTNLGPLRKLCYFMIGLFRS